MKREITLAYLLQITSVIVLAAQHFLLPIYIGLQNYGLLAFSIGSASLLSCTYDHGYNLLTIKKPALGHRYLGNKLAILSVAAVAFYCYARIAQTAQYAIVFPILSYGFLFVIYTYLIHLEIAAGRLKKVLVFSVANGLFLFAVPIAVLTLQINIAYAPVIAAILTLGFLAILSDLGNRQTAIRSVLSVELRLDHVWKSFVKQGQISLGTIVDGTIIWIGVVVIASLQGFEAAAIYRIIMSAVALMRQLIPLPKQVLLKFVRKQYSAIWMSRYAVGLAVVGVAQFLLVFFYGRQAISSFFPEAADDIYRGVLLLSPVPALKALFELETVLYDRSNKLPRMPRNVLIASACAIAAFVRLDLYWSILVFYSVLSAVSAPAFLAKPNKRISN